MDPELERISENLKRLVAAKAAPADLDAYLKSEGVSRARYAASVDVGRLLRDDEVASQFRGTGEGKPMMTGSEMARVMAAGILPGFSDEVIGAVAGMLDGNRSIAEATANEREILASARSKEGSTGLEILTGLATGVGLTKLAAKGIPGLSRAASILTGGVSKGAPASVLGGVGQGVKSGTIVGTIAGAGNADGGNLWDRAVGGLQGAAGGAILGGTLGGVFTYGGNKLFPAQLDPTDAAQVFPLGTPAKVQREAAQELSDAMHRGGVDVPGAQASAAAMQRGGVAPMLGDVAGPSLQGDITTIDRLSQTRGAGASNALKDGLVPRELERSTRRAGAVANATGRPTPSFPEYIDKLKAQKRALDDIMFGRFRVAAEAKGPMRAGRLRTPDQLKKTLMDPKFFNAAVKLEEEMVSNQAAGVAGKYVSPFRPVLDGEGVPTGEFEVKDFLDPVTLSELSRVLGGMREEAYAAAGNARLARAPAAAKQQIDDLLSTIPSFKEANALSARMNQRIEAAEQGYKRALNGKPGALEADKAKYGGKAIPLPKDVRVLLAGPDAPPELAGRTSLGPAWSDYEAGAQSARVDPLLMAKNPTKANAVVAPSRDAALFGQSAADRIQVADDAEAAAARFAQSSPTAQGRINPVRGVSPEDRAIEGASAASKYLMRFGGGPTGVGLAAVDAAGRAARYGFPMSAERMTAIAQGAVAPAAPALNLIDQIRAASNTPARRGLLGGLGYTTGGLFGDNRQ